MENIRMDLRLFDANTQVTTQQSLTEEMKTFYSDYLIDAAEPELVHDQFAQKHPIPANGGKTIQFRRFAPLGKALTALTEGVTPDGQSLSMSTVEAAVRQYGGYIQMSDLLLLTAIDNNLTMATKLLGAQAGRTLDTITREVLVGSDNVQYADESVSARYLLRGGNAGAADNNYLTVDCIRRAVRALKNANCRRIDGAFPVIIHPDVAYDLMNDPKWLAPHQYVDTEHMYEGEIGKIEGCRFVESTEAKIFHAEDLAADSRTLLANGAVSGKTSVAFDGGTVKPGALVGRQVLIGNACVTVRENTASSMTVDAPVTVEDNAILYPGEAGAQGRDVYVTLVLGADGYGTTENTVPATCGADGHIDTVCANCGDVIATKVIPATGAHTWDNGTVTTEPTETTPGVRTFTCAVCSQTKTEVIPATGEHTFVFTKNVAPSCTEAGYDLYTCRDCGASEQRNVKPALGHKWDSGTVTTEPTEKDPGTMTYTCTVCGQTKTEVIPATGPHTHVWDEGTVTVAPTETTPGVRTYTCTVCGQTRTEIIPATGSAVCPGGAACPSFRFRDVPAPSNWAHEGIDYCVRHGLMSGFDATTFSPDTVSTRAQIVMILYNLSGDTTDYSKYYVPFTDVRPGTWYYNAVAWGYDKDIVSGMTPTTFAPDGLITREQMAVLLYGYTEKYAPAYLGGAASLNGFPDAASVSNWAYAAMSWAVGNGLISGIASNGADYLAPSGGATRAQIAAIMMRYCRLTGL